jgi:(E)-4-hydroxy-3-methylbut-2-enyl-diphosphate synthase
LKRRRSKQVSIGSVAVGGDAPISVQSMTKTPAGDVDATVRQIRELADLGCEIVRVAVPSRAEAKSVPAIKAGSPLPVVADVHFSAEIALEAVKAGADAVRINPGNTKDIEGISALAGAARERGVPIRVGTNSGSVGCEGAEDMARRLVDVCLEACGRLEEMDFHDIIVSFKANTCDDTIRAYRMAAERCEYPFHVGMTATGPAEQGLEGIGDTVRVSLTGPPHGEVTAAYEILSAAGSRRRGPEIVACPTCGRCNVDVVGLAEEVKRVTSGWTEDITIAVMGCEVNGPGEAREADVGIAGAGSKMLLFSKGVEMGRLEPSSAVRALIEEARRISSEKR